MQVRDDREREDEGDRRRERGVEEVLDERLADRTEGDREGGDSELDVPMKRTGSSMIRRAILARRLPSAASSDRRERLAVTSEYSAATKNAFPATSRRTARISRKTVTPRFPGRGY